MHACLLDVKSQAYNASVPIADSTASIVENAFHKGKPIESLRTWHTGNSTKPTANLNHRQGPERMMKSISV